MCVKMIESAQAGSSQTALSQNQRARFRQLEFWASRKLCQVYKEEGKVKLAKPLAEALVAAVENHELAGAQAGFAWSELGTVALAEGRPRDALKAFETEEALSPKQGWSPPSVAWSEGQRGSACLALGDYQRAERLLTNGLPVLEHHREYER